MGGQALPGTSSRLLILPADGLANQLPREIETKILALMKIFGLVYGAFDFIVTPDGRYVFLEVNPSGQYMWIECATGLEITAALADALMAPCRP